MSFSSVDHMGFTVEDLDRSVEFYTALLGVGPYFRSMFDVDYVGEKLGYPSAQMDVAHFRLPGVSVYLELIQYTDRGTSRVDMETYNVGSAHLCLRTDDIEGDFDRLRQVGAVFRSEKPIMSDFGPFKGALGAYLRDPDGISIELVQDARGT